MSEAKTRADCIVNEDRQPTGGVNAVGASFSQSVVEGSEAVNAEADSSKDSPGHAKPTVPYSVFSGRERWAIIIMASMASFARYVVSYSLSEVFLLISRDFLTLTICRKT